MSQYQISGVTFYRGTLDENKAERIEQVKGAFVSLCEEAYPDLQMQLAGLDSLPRSITKTMQSQGVAALARRQSLIDAVNACTTNEEVWAVNIDYSNLNPQPAPERFGLWTTVSKTANQSVTNSATLVTDNELTFPMLANTKYRIRGMIFFDTTATGDFKYTVQGPANPTGVRISPATAVGGGTPAMAAVLTAYPSATGVALAGTGTSGFVQFDAIVHNGSTAGDFLFRFAQNTQTAGQSATVIAGSYLEYATV